MNYYIIKGHSGRLAVVDYPPGMDVYVKGPGPMDSCFEVMEEMNKNQLVKGDAMRTLVTLAAVILMGAFAGMAMAEGDGNGGRDNSAASSSAVAAAFGVGVAGSISEGGSASAEGGDATASGGNPSAAGGQGVGNVSYETKIPRQAPSVYVPALNNTAPGLKCFGFGGSFAEDGTAGGGAVGWCWLARDGLALKLYHQHAQAGQPEEAARVFCSKPLLRAGYAKPGLKKRDVIAACEQGEAASIRAFINQAAVSEQYVDDAVAAGMAQVREDVLTERNAVCDEKVARCERAVLK